MVCWCPSCAKAATARPLKGSLLSVQNLVREMLALCHRVVHYSSPRPFIDRFTATSASSTRIADSVECNGGT